MSGLNDRKFIQSLDKGNAHDSISLLADQCRQAWSEGSQIIFGAEYSNPVNVVISGMGGSSYGARIIKSLYDSQKSKRIPIELANGYRLPGYVNKKTLVVASSYSGTTEETLKTVTDAAKIGCMITGITTGGPLAEFLSKNDFPYYKFDPKFNPSRQPRIGVGYMVMGLIGILAKLNIIPAVGSEIRELVKFLRLRNKTFVSDYPIDINPAKRLAVKLKGKVPVFIVADFLDGAAYAIRNPFHETAKQFALYFSVPELNHHLMEGLSFPVRLNKFITFIMVNSSLYEEKNAKRMNLTREVIEKNKYPTLGLTLSGGSRICQTMELIQIGSWVSFYLAMLNKVDPSKIPFVDYFKKRLKG